MDGYPVPESNTTVHISGVNWYMREDDFLPQFLTLGNHNLPWGHTGVLGVNVGRQAMRHDHNLSGNAHIRFATQSMAQAFIDEFDGMTCAGRRLEVNMAYAEMIILPRSQWEAEITYGKSRFKEDVWSFPPEAHRPGVAFTERPRPCGP